MRQRLQVAVQVAFVVWFALAPTAALAGASYFEGFENAGAAGSGGGPQELVSAGWTFRNQSKPRGSGGWFGLGVEPYEGKTALAVDHRSSTCESGSSISTWAILPSVPGQVAGDVLSFFVRGGLGARVDRLQVRYSPTGGTSTGSGATDVGDFTSVLLDWQSERWGISTWTEQSVTLPGSGRIAFRYFLPDADVCTSFAYLLRIDAVSIGGRPGGGVPLPRAGETVVWDQALSPVTIDGRLTIPTGGTVVVDPGVDIRLQPNSTLVVEGALRGRGTAERPISVAAPSVFPPALEVTGTLDLGQASVAGQVRIGSGASVVVSDASFHGAGTVTTVGGSVDTPAFVRVERSRFDGVDLYLHRSTVVLRDVDFVNASAIALDSNPSLDGVRIDGGKLALSRDGQPVHVNGVTVTNAPGAALELGGANYGNDFLLGPAVDLRGNGYPVAVGDGGLLPGSTVPATGNVRNAVLADSGDARGPATWADVGVPYEIPNERRARGPWDIHPGVTVRLGPGAAIFDHARGLRARGIEGQPITFERLDPTRAWYRFDTPGRLEHAVVDGSTHGLIYSTTGSPQFVDSSTVRNNERGVVGSAVIRGTRFLGNTTGARVGAVGDLNGATNPNSFVGNGLAVEAASDARHNWWGDPSGPTSPDNPAGRGDAAAAGVPIKPFRTAAPDPLDSPPVVRLTEPAFLIEPGKRVALSWEASDDGTISSQRVLFSREGDSPGAYAVVAELPPGQRTFEWLVPDVGFQVTGAPASVRVEAVDDAGQVGWDAFSPAIPSGRVSNGLTFTSDLTGPFQAGSRVDVCYAGNTDTSFNSVAGYLFLDGDRRVIPLGGTVAQSGCLPLGAQLPFVSTDTARIGLRLHGSTNDFAWTFSQPFAIRADARLGDAPPTVALSAPAVGQAFAPGATVPISWTAGDDQGVRSFDVQASYDQGRTWHDVARNLSAAARSHSWQTPAGQGLGSIRLRVVARDLRFQNSSASVDVTVGSAQTQQPPPSDTVTVTKAEYRTGKRTLRVEASSTASDATLTVRATATGALIGTLVSQGGGRYADTFSLASNPGRVTVSSNRGGSATVTVDERR